METQMSSLSTVDVRHFTDTNVLQTSGSATTVSPVLALVSKPEMRTLCLNTGKLQVTIFKVTVFTRKPFRLRLTKDNLYILYAWNLQIIFTASE